MSSRNDKLAELAGLMEEAAKLKRTRAMDFYMPTPKQEEFHTVGAQYRQRMLSAGNQCLTAQTYIQTDHGERQLLDMIALEGFDVQSWDGETLRNTQAAPVFLKGMEPAFRVYLDNGKVFESSRKHRVYAGGEWLSLDQLIQRASGLHLTRELLSSLDSYAEDGRLNDEQLQWALDNAQVQPPSQPDAQKYNHYDARMDEAARILAHSHISPSSGLLTISDDDRKPLADLCESFADPNASQTVQRNFAILRQLRQFGRVSDLPQGELPANPGSIYVSFESPVLFGSFHIWGVEALGTRPILDFHVPEYENYIAAGTLHHNTGKTYSAGMEISYHMTGQYPDWWKGRRFDRPVVGWAGGVTAVSTRDNPQRILLGRKRDWGTGTIPKASLIGNPILARGEPDSVDSFTVQHVSGGLSTCYFKNYSQGREKWQGETLDFCWMDEEPPYEIYEEALTRLNRNKGSMLITFTPLLGMTEVVEKFYHPADDDKGAKHRTVVHMTLEDATFYTAQEREEIEYQYPEWMRRARVQGLPVIGEGMVYPLLDEVIATPAFPIPRHWRRIAGLDFGVSHPTAVVWMAYNPDADIIYIYDVYKEKENDLLKHADAINSHGKWIPVAWPHDGLKTEMGSGKSYADLYREKGVYMLRMSARYDNKTGGRQAVEPVTDSLLNRMQTGRLKVFSHLRDWFTEKNSYHRKDGKIVDYNDDIMSAMRYGAMMLRFARTRNEMDLTTGKTEDYDPLGAW